MSRKMSFVEQVQSLELNFWYACSMEVLERLAFFGVRAIAPLYLIASTGHNGLNLSYVEKGEIYSVWALLQCLIPMVSGGYTERYGYRKSLAVAFVINVLGYVGMAQSKPIADSLAAWGWENAAYWVFMAAACLVATGTAIFKPPVQGTVARTTSEETSSTGWGVFYWVVNIGGALGPMCAAPLRGEINWDYVFYAAAAVTALNFLPAFLLYKEPEKVPATSPTDSSQGPFGVFWSSISTMFKDLRLVVFLAIFSCFFLMFMQLWDLLPNFVDEWVNTSDVAPYFQWFSEGWVQKSGQTKPEIIINIDAWAILVLVIPISWLVGRINKIAAMVIGMIIAMVGFVGAGATSIGVVCCLLVFVFSIGEMVCAPTFNAYVGLIAPADKKALYMGYANIPFAVGWAAGGVIGGVMYERIASKFRLAREYLVDHLGMTKDLVMDPDKLPKERVMETLTRALKAGDGASIQQRVAAAWDHVDWNAIPKEKHAAKIVELWDQVLNTGSGIDVSQATRMLWDLHHPYLVWYYLGAIGLIGTVGMTLFYFVARRVPARSVQAQEAAPVREELQASCPYCDHLNPEQAAFCGHCGKGLK